MATSTRGLTVPTKEAADERRCSCGCAPCEGTCCQFDCIVRPRFFCGQLLTDADLSAMLKWARDRFGLSRYRHGWGVVCGLDVRCDPKRPAAIVVTPGYAVDCCGNDIVVCETAALDLSGACREEEDPCADLRRRYEAVVVPGEAHEVKRELEGKHPAGGLVWTPGKAEMLRTRVVDIYLRYDERPSEPATALGRGSCKQVTECEYSRTRESYKLTWEFGVEGSDPVEARAARWHEGYEKCLDVLKEFRARFTNGFPAADVKRWLVRWIDAHPESSLCGTRDAVCNAVESLTQEKNLVGLLFELVTACRTSYLNCDCFGCERETGVPLARVWLTMDEGGGQEACRIRAIDPYPPYRRPIMPDCWPAPLGSVNVGRFIWHRWEEACTSLDDLGVSVTRKEFMLPATLTALEKALGCNLFVGCDERRDALVYKTELFGERVVGFCATTDIPHPTAPDMTLTKASKPAEGRAGQSVVYVFEVRNTGNVALQVKVEDASLKLSKDLGMIEPGKSQAFEQQGTIPQGASGSFSNTATATGTAGGQTITRNATANITILGPDCPNIEVTSPKSVVADEPITFTAIIRGGDPKVTPTYNWSVSTNAVSSGQGTNTITVDTHGADGASSITATVEVGGFDPRCRTVASSTTALATRAVPVARKFDEFDDLKRGDGEGDAEGGGGFADENARLDNFAIQLQTEPGSQGHIIVYASPRTGRPEFQERTARAKDYLVNIRGIDASRVVTLDGGLRDALKFELWIVPAGAAPPTPIPIVSAQLQDDLTEFKQIGPARAGRLEAAGIRTFADLASTSAAHLKELIPELGEDVLRGWIESAKNRTQ
jgi:hypothetical protein